MIRTNVTSFKKIIIGEGQRVTFCDMNDQPLNLPLLETCDRGEICNCIFNDPRYINLAYHSTFNMTKKGDYIGCIDCQGIVIAEKVLIINVNIPKHPLNLIVKCDELLFKRNNVGHNYQINNGFVKKITLIQVFEFTQSLETDEVVYDTIKPFESKIIAKKITLLNNLIN